MHQKKSTSTVTQSSKCLVKVDEANIYRWGVREAAPREGEREVERGEGEREAELLKPENGDEYMSIHGDIKYKKSKCETKELIYKIKRQSRHKKVHVKHYHS